MGKIKASMKIGIFTDTYKPNINGVVTSIETTKYGLEAAGQEVYVFAPNQSFKYETSRREKTWWLPSVKFYGEKRYRVAFPFLNMDDIAKVALDVVHTQTPFLVGIAGLRTARRKNLPLVHTYHTRYQEYAHYLKFPKKILQLITGAGMKRIVTFMNKHDAVIAPSLGVKRELENFGVQKSISVIPTGIDIEKTLNLSKKNDPGYLLKKFGISDKDDLITLTSRLGKEKNIDFVLRAMKRVVAQKPSAKLLIIGDGDAKNYLRNLAKTLNLGKNVVFPGFMRHDDIFPLYRRAKLFVFSSFTETQGIVVLEAMALGLPVVALRGMGIEDILEKNTGGVLVENSDGLFAEKILELLNDKRLLRKKSAEAQGNAKNFSVEKMTDKLLHLHQNVITSKATDYARQKVSK